MTIKWTPDGKVDREWLFDVATWDDADFRTLEIADALDECVAALRDMVKHSRRPFHPDGSLADAERILRKIGAEP